MPRPSKINYDFVAQKIEILIKNKINGDKFPTFNQIIKETGGNANTLNLYIKKYKEQQAKMANSQIEILKQQVSKFAEVNEKFVGDYAKLNSKIDILKNENAVLKNENDLLKIENAKLKNQIQNNNAYEQILELLKNHSADFKIFEKNSMIYIT